MSMSDTTRIGHRDTPNLRSVGFIAYNKPSKTLINKTKLHIIKTCKKHPKLIST